MANSEAKLKQILQKIAKEQDYAEGKIEIKAISSGGANYTTDLFLATISKSMKPDINLFAKVANLTEDIRSKNEMMAKVYLVEAVFYTVLAVNFERIYLKNNVPIEHRLQIPKYYGHILTPLEECMVLENLEVRGFHSFDRMKTFNWDYASTAVQQMAKFHAVGLAFKDENPTEFQSVISQIESDYFGDAEISKLFMTQAINNGCEAVSKEHAERLRKFFSTNDVIMDLMKKFMTDKTMLVHGDFRPSNLMHRRRNGKLEIVPLDYQTLRLGNAVGDLMHFIFCGSDEEFRRLHYHRLLNYYHEELGVELERLHIDVEKIYPKKIFDQDLIDALPLGLVLGLTMAAVVTVAPEDAPKLDGDLTDMSIKPNELAQERIKGIVKDFVRWNVI